MTGEPNPADQFIDVTDDQLLAELRRRYPRMLFAGERQQIGGEVGSANSEIVVSLNGGITTGYGLIARAEREIDGLLRARTVRGKHS
ncbi:MAG TPA: hypothetical protein VK176_16325 [Phycisphaerales bacterium]|nr:hypothetical protein [Phycisphaerales bacterium]